MDVLNNQTGTLRAEAHHPPLVAAGFSAEQSAQTRSIGYEEEKSPTLRAGVTPATIFGTDSETDVTYGLDRAAFNQGQNAKYNFAVEKEISPTMVAKGPGAVFAASHTSFFSRTTKEQAETLVATDYKDPPVVYRPFDLIQITIPLHANSLQNTEVNGTLNTGTPGVVEERNLTYLCRRLTPLECCRLQGFPDYWCQDLEIENPTDEELEFWKEVFETHRQIMNPNGKPKTEKQIRKWLKTKHAENAEYKMWGNGVALPCVFFILKGIEWWEREGQYTQPPFDKFEGEEPIQSSFLGE